MDAISSSFLTTFPQLNLRPSPPKHTVNRTTLPTISSVHIEERSQLATQFATKQYPPPPPLSSSTVVSPKQPSKPRNPPPPTAPTTKQYKRPPARPAPSLPVTVCNALDDFINNFIDRQPLRSSVDPKHVLADNFAPVTELEPTECVVEEGSIPRCLNGAYIRNGPNPQFVPRGAHHLFDGDGMLHCVRLQNGRATFCARFVKTYKYVQERDTGSPLFPNTFSGFDGLVGFARGGVLVARVLTGQVNPLNGAGQANTSLALVNGVLMALGESDLPYAVHVTPQGDIKTICRWDFQGKLFMAMTAHPKLDPRTGETFAFRYGPIPPFLTLFRIRPDGTKSDDVGVFSVSNPSFVHDFAITDKYALFPDIQILMKPLDMLTGQGPPVGYDAEKISRVGVIPRYAKDDSEMRWFPVPGFNFVHTVNAWDEGDEVVLVAANTMPTEHILGRMDLVHCCLEMVRINLKEGTVVSRQPLSAKNLEFGVINATFLGKKNRFAYMGIGDPMPKISGIAKLDFEKSGDGECVVASRHFGEGCFGGEPFFVAKNDNGGEEDDGYVVTYMHDEQTGVSRFLVMDAKSPSLDIVASVRLPQRVPYGFHGLFVKEKDLQKQRNLQ